jgi:hypothetical protein
MEFPLVCRHACVPCDDQKVTLFFSFLFIPIKMNVSAVRGAFTCHTTVWWMLLHRSGSDDDHRRRVYERELTAL